MKEQALLEHASVKALTNLSSLDRFLLQLITAKYFREFIVYLRNFDQRD
jgi:hypothetical protein